MKVTLTEAIAMLDEIATERALQNAEQAREDGAPPEVVEYIASANLERWQLTRGPIVSAIRDACGGDLRALDALSNPPIVH